MKISFHESLGKTTILKEAHESLLRNSFLSSLSLLMKSFEDKFNHREIM